MQLLSQRLERLQAKAQNRMPSFLQLPSAAHLTVQLFSWLLSSLLPFPTLHAGPFTIDSSAYMKLHPPPLHEKKALLLCAWLTDSCMNHFLLLGCILCVPS